MTNQEVNEFMQRFLDDDLNEDELEALMEHIRLTPASATLFERLQRLDSELEQLPKVIPPKSIVDSILPRLELAGLVDHPSVTGIAAIDNLPNRVVPMERRAKFIERINYRLLGGVVAAGIVLTLFLSNYDPQMSFNTAEEDTALSESADTMMVAENSATLKKEVAPSQSLSAEAEQDRNTEQLNEVGDKLPITYSSDPVAPKADSNTPMSNDLAEAPSPWVDNGKALRTGVSDTGVAVDAPDSEALPDVEDTLVIKATSDNEPAASAAEEPAQDQKMFTTTQLPAVASPNEQFTGTVTAVAEGGQQIIITDQSSNQVYESAVYQGSLNQLTWSPDSTQLHFEVTEDNESIVHMTIHVTAQTESIK